MVQISKIVEKLKGGVVRSNSEKMVLGMLRITLGWVLFWAFVDKVFGLGFATEAGKSWLEGVSPTAGFLKFGTSGPFSELFVSMSGNVVVDWLFMLGLAGIGSALILGIGMRIATITGVVLMALLFGATVPPEHNPLVDEHVVYGLLMVLFSMTDAGDTLGLGKKWKKTALVKQWPILK